MFFVIVQQLNSTQLIQTTLRRNMVIRTVFLVVKTQLPTLLTHKLRLCIKQETPCNSLQD